MFGAIEFEEFKGLTKMPQKAASAWATLEGLVGASYKPLLYLGSQQVNGTLHWFIAEQALMTYPPIRRVIKLAIRELDGDYKLIEGSIETIC